MVFPSLPIYSSDPLNWPQQQVISEGGGSYQNNNQHHLQPPPPPSDGDGDGGGGGSIKPANYMTDRARGVVAKIPQPEVALKCPRCESTNTKFCYFNNYSLTQPRHFCKTCRRYWTRGGALRNVPVGGGCRRNKRTGKGSRSKSPAAGDHNNNNFSPTSSALPPPTNSDVIMTHFPQQQLPNFHQYGGGSSEAAGLSFGGIQVGGVRGNGNNNNDVEFQMNISNGFSEQWRLHQHGHHQFPNFLNGMEAAPATGNMYTFEPEPPQNRSKALETAVKMEDSTRQGLNLSRNFLGISGDDHNQYWGGGGTATAPAANAWTELGGFTNSSARHIL